MLKESSSAIGEAAGSSGNICCFCAREVEGSHLLVIDITYPDKASQSLFSHHDCLGIRLHESVPFLSHAEWNEPQDR